MAAIIHAIDPWPLDEPFPATLTDEQLMRVVQLKKSAFYAAKRRGVFKRFEAKGMNLRSTRYSGELVRDYVNQQPISQFGRKRSPKAAHAEAVQ